MPQTLQPAELRGLQPLDSASFLQGTLSEQQALDTTLLQGPRAASARMQLGIAKALTTQAKIYPNPAAEYDIGFAELSYRAGVAVPIQPPWKMVQRIISAKAQIDVANLQLMQALWVFARRYSACIHRTCNCRRVGGDDAQLSRFDTRAG